MPRLIKPSSYKPLTVSALPRKIGLPVSRWQRLLEVFLLLLAFAVLLWVTAVFSNRYALGVLSDQGEQRLNLYASSLQSGFEKYDYLPEMLSVDSKLLDLLNQPEKTSLVLQANLLMERLNAMAGTSATYLMDANGLTIASSNWQEDRSFVGKNFKFRPYFQTAIKGYKGRYFAHGITSQKPGYFISHPVLDAGEILGVIVVKVGIEDLEKSWAKTRPDDRVIVTDEHGVIFITSFKPWKYRSLYPVADEIRREIIKTRQYDNALIEPLSVRISEETADGNPILMIDQWRRARKPETGQYLVQSTDIGGTGWIIQLLSNTSSAKPIISVALLVVGSLFVVIFIIVLYVNQRRQVLHERWLAEQRAQAVLKTARDQLEDNVKQRTSDLTKTNTELRRQITERQKAEKELQNAQNELIQASKLAALGGMSAGVTHELNQPMTAIRSYADNAAALIKMDRLDEASANLKTIGELTDRVARITGQLKMFARKSVARVKPVSLKGALDSSLMQLMPRIQSENVAVIQHIPEGRIWVMGGIIRLEQILINLMNNALDAMTDETPSSDIQKRLEVTISKSDNFVTLSICDTGPGISAETMSRIFDPFFTTKMTGKGLGLGLSITLGIVKELGGEINAENRADVGACFHVKLQAAVEKKEEILD
ncbi:MAG: sensor histidine kinase [Sneathiella sp.]|nr:sensor histidine kinase [Sneathiella sp.]